jgi:hypothetical protein
MLPGVAQAAMPSVATMASAAAGAFWFDIMIVILLEKILIEYDGSRLNDGRRKIPKYNTR